MQLREMPKAPEKELPPAQMFDGRFFFTNPYSEDFTARWGGVDYDYKAFSTSPMLIQTETVSGIQNIRKDWAYQLGLREFMKTKKYKDMSSKKHGVTPQTYSESDPELVALIQRCLEPLPIINARARKVEKYERPLTTDPKTGKPVIKLMTHEDNNNHSLIEEAANA